ncbi:MAG: ribonuclease HIII [Victivallaceae bacterium]|nr:ribonuclease HIII [Victivallaceae bacterium]
MYKGNLFVVAMTPPEIAKLEEILRARSWEFFEQPYARFRAGSGKCQIVAYLSGKVTVQGRDAAETMEFLIEPEITGVIAAPSPESVKTSEVELDLRKHIGVDESGKGDFFGPLVIAGVYSDESTAAALAEAGAKDSKLIKKPEVIVRLAAEIRRITRGNFAVVTLRPETYNDLYGRIGNLNRLLAWGHARAIENVLEKVPDCPRALSDKFGAEHLIRNALMSRGRSIELEQRVRGESDVAVAAASILARDQFLRIMAKLSEEAGVTLPKGAGPQVVEMMKKLRSEQGDGIFSKLAKLHFKTWLERDGVRVTEK